MGRYSEESIQKVLTAADIVAVVERYMPLRKAGTVYKGLCPFHHEKTPSFTVNPTRQSFKCFGCGEGGGAIGFVMKYENLKFGDAVRKLAEMTGVVLVEEAETPQQERERRTRGKLLDLHREAGKWMHELLQKDAAAEMARRYLKGRGYGSEMAARWSVGWMPGDARRFFEWAKGRGVTGRELVASGICALKDEGNPGAGLKLRFRNRLMFPVANERGEIVGFSGRILEADDRAPKYVNSPETEIFRKGDVVFGLDRARRGIAKAECVVICEGQLDCIACHEAGITHVVAPLGTAFTAQHARLLKRYANRAVLCLDGDKAGRAAVERAFRELVVAGMRVDVATLPQGEDPDSLLKAGGKEALERVLREAVPYFVARVEWAKAEGRLEMRADRIAFGQELVEQLAMVPDGVARDGMTLEVAARLQLGIEEMRTRVKYTRKDAGSRQERDYGRGREQERVEVVEAAGLDSFARTLCEMALLDAEGRKLLRERIEELTEAFEYLKGGEVAGEVVRNGPELETGDGAVKTNAARVMAYLETLKPEWRLALVPLLDAPGVADAGRAVGELMASIGRTVLQRKIEGLLAELKMDGLTMERRMSLLERLKRLRAMG